MSIEFNSHRPEPAISPGRRYNIKPPAAVVFLTVPYGIIGGFLTIFAAVFFGFLSYGLYNLIQALRSRRWPSVQGFVVTSALEEHGPGEPARALVTYRYAPSGANLLGRRVFFGDAVSTGWGKKAALRRVSKYAPGSAVTVFYHPVRHHLCVLERTCWPAIAFILFSVPFLIWQALLLLGWWLHQ